MRQGEKSPDEGKSITSSKPDTKFLQIPDLQLVGSNGKGINIEILS